MMWLKHHAYLIPLLSRENSFKSLVLLYLVHVQKTKQNKKKKKKKNTKKKHCFLEHWPEITDVWMWNKQIIIF